MRHDIIVIAASAGGLTPLRQLAGALPADLAASLFIVLHIGPYVSLLPEILSRAGALPALHPAEHELIRQGRIYVAPPDHHLLLHPGFIRLSRGPRENRARPAADPLFRSAAGVYGPRVMGIVLSGMLSDGTAGLAEIKRHGGMAIAQDPREAEFPSMPRSAMQYADVDYAIPVAEIAGMIIRAAGLVTPRRIPVSHPVKELAMSGEYSLQPPRTMICPDCGGALTETDLGTRPYYRCHIGHAYSPADMEAGQFREMERAQETAMRVMVERVALCHRFAQAAGDTGHAGLAAEWAAAAAQAEARAAQMRALLGQSWLRPAPDGAPLDGVLPDGAPLDGAPLDGEVPATLQTDGAPG